ncbi:MULTISPECIES: alpha/beta hydrolase [Bacillus]|uniref:alpha/beta hydrolase n=1 Tax=Bacillus TaxID=1386 RepID=UPI0020CF0D04|nr:alpha/beta hydrolase [Bacillus safensis]MCP9282877.1 alpha/beta hydrolase [Bacillus safensis]
MSDIRIILDEDNEPFYYKEKYIVVSRDNNDIGIRMFVPLIKNNKYIFYFPGRWQNSKDWAFENAIDDIRYYLLTKGFSIITIDYRTNFQNYRKTEHFNGINWHLSDFIQDSTYVLNYLYKKQNIKKAYLMGFSMGAAQIFLLNQSVINTKIEGIIALDGGIKQKKLQLNYFHQNNSKKLLKNPAWDKKFRDKYIKLVHSLNKKGKNYEININKIRILLNGEKWWPENPVSECKTISSSIIHNDSILDKHMSDISCPILCVMAIDKLGADSHRSLCSAILTSSKDIKSICLENWSHLDILSHVQAKEKVFAPINKWLLDKRCE